MRRMPCELPVMCWAEVVAASGANASSNAHNTKTLSSRPPHLCRQLAVQLLLRRRQL